VSVKINSLGRPPPIHSLARSIGPDPRPANAAANKRHSVTPVISATASSHELGHDLHIHIGYSLEPNIAFAGLHHGRPWADSPRAYGVVASGTFGSASTRCATANAEFAAGKPA